MNKCIYIYFYIEIHIFTCMHVYTYTCIHMYIYIEFVLRALNSDPLSKHEDLVETTLQDGSEVLGFDSSCFNGEYVTGDIDDGYLERLDNARNDAAKGRSHADDAVIDLHNDDDL